MKQPIVNAAVTDQEKHQNSMHRNLLNTIAAIILLNIAACSHDKDSVRERFTQLHAEWIVSAEDAQEWAMVKGTNLPTLTGSPEWHNYMSFLEKKIQDYGVVDAHRNAWSFQRWDTSDDNTDWSLTVEGKDIKVANYGANSGSTDAEGISAELVYYDHDNPPESIRGKIVVIPTRPHPQPPYDDYYIRNYTFNDYEYRADDDTFQALFEYVDPADSFTFDIWWQLAQDLDKIAVEGGAAGAVIVYDMAFERTVGLYTFPVPELYDSPTLILDRDAGAQVIADAKAGKQATLRLQATIEPAQAYQLVAYLPGKDYGTAKDEQIVLVNHTDGPSITQDNGALGLLAIIKYFSHIPQSQRPRTLTLYLDCRHYMPGMEKAFMEQTWLTREPGAKDPMVGMIHIEHMGEMDYREVDGRVEATGLAEQSYLWTRDNPVLIEAALAAAKTYDWHRVQVSVPERPGIHGGLQQIWWGVGVLGQRDNKDVTDAPQYNCEVWHCLDLPGFGLGSFLGHYWTSNARIDRWNRELFLAQARTMIHLTGVLMTADLKKIRPRQ